MMNNPMTNAPQASSTSPSRFSNWKLWAIVAVCVAPVLASYLSYYVIKPEAKSNYGELVEPQRDVPATGFSALDGSAFDPAQFKGKWAMIHADGGACPDACAKQLYIMRQLRATQGKDQDRIEVVWLITNAEEVPAVVRNAYGNIRMLRADPKILESWLPSSPAEWGGRIFLVDPMGHLMMRWPSEPDPNGMKRDLIKLLRASRVG